MPRRKVPGADYAVRNIDPRDLPADVEEAPAAAGAPDAPAEPVLDIRTLHNHSMPQLVKIAQDLEVEGAPSTSRSCAILTSCGIEWLCSVRMSRTGSAGASGAPAAAGASSTSAGRSRGSMLRTA